VSKPENKNQPLPTVGLFVTCLVDLYRPVVGFAAVRLLEQAGFEVLVPDRQTCCGQPAYNAGDRKTAKALAQTAMEAFAGCDYVVAPSGSCAAMLKHHWPDLFDPESHERALAQSFADKVFELTSFLVDIGGVTAVTSGIAGRATYHDSCSGLRELGVRWQPRQLLTGVDGLELVEMADSDACCGFGGLFCVKYPDISNAMLDKKLAAIEASGADLLLGGDLGCLMNMAGKLSRAGSSIKVRHVAEVLAGLCDEPPVAGRKEG
jgi:L-lactate dehydrogenase complex protein LldE